MIRLIIVVLWIVLFLVGGLPLLLAEFIVGLFSKKARAVSSQAIISFAFNVIVFICHPKVIIKGKEKVPQGEGVMYVPNHRGMFDILLLYPNTAGQTAFVAKKEIEVVPIFSIWMKFMNCLFLDRKDLRAGLKVILKSAEYAKEGTSVAIFPEGTRNKTDEDLQPFRDGSFKIAEKSGCVVVPVAISNTEQVFEAHPPFVKTATIVLEFCDPIYTKDYTKEDFKGLSQKVQEEILTAYRANKELVKDSGKRAKN